MSFFNQTFVHSMFSAPSVSSFRFNYTKVSVKIRIYTMKRLLCNLQITYSLTVPFVLCSNALRITFLTTISKHCNIEEPN